MGENLAPSKPESAPSLAGRTTEHFIERIPVEGSQIRTCTGDLIAFSAVYIISINQVTDENLTAPVAINQLFKGTGIGQPSGTKYLIREHYHFHVNLPNSTSPNITFKDHFVARLVSQGSLPNTFASLQVHTIINSRGEVTVKVHEVTPECAA
ncbi:MAG TPA: hypothetical protein VM347_07975 [Nonomuraea sp.]|nr:hypothetical protein [Nonomuraea sp.]